MLIGCISYISIFLDGVISGLAINSQLWISYGKEAAGDFGIGGNREVAGVETTGIPALICAVAVLAELVLG